MNKIFDVAVLVFLWMIGLLLLAAAIGPACVGCGPAFTLESDPEPKVIVIETGELEPPASSVVVPEPPTIGERPRRAEVRPTVELIDAGVNP